MPDRKLGQNLKSAREKVGLTQQQVADKTGIHVNYYARMEQGRVEVPLRRLNAYAKLFKVKAKDLLPN
ncbi:hypothetical protein A2631_02295 [Candidatus Daviesbacteria bacterium RIFCSPHIGHO2_01_FULL_44_29]|uniref:HTH cro/C1-type domain-containing protein n=1 Tax=Candidatus Daviesbacteria bacterium RIFCSPHIGHO2_02_FULL_43_12 TaxID=1797776 RepID=A0A1F5KK00_9BACT|nr:MAG: hypothetical protein A2631_02295 [Candidatus Daviesbacteria bacterium RIFCSPHIGHO2_01_FULL_44_29]OGE40993.1 MAG: hypothetical protein A3E86_03660 [Candidatus Daviesbacteria bacterium RIFCSPHIGHO2_12_FULL_47_45]OGE41222.1 MAG: hypothetical protein A3D25_01690 [Candidatus Daviesbacteria bacterium RIFCSPHIGHO2_02_FULL_43_12]OGE69422.1 MAG: hypothetical protein A3B55_03430 [Candidatus Daviesbacteria bacterium RIFCSPLOWO2_01_FULL_43_15]